MEHQRKPDNKNYERGKPDRQEGRDVPKGRQELRIVVHGDEVLQPGEMGGERRQCEIDRVADRIDPDGEEQHDVRSDEQVAGPAGSHT